MGKETIDSKTERCAGRDLGNESACWFFSSERPDGGTGCSGMNTKAHITYKEFGQSIWYDNIRRKLLDNGEFARFVAAGVRGCTSNPSIFNAAIAGSSDYDAALRRLVSEGRTVEDIYYQLVVDDIRSAADALFDVYESSKFRDGYVSVEVLPKHALDTQGTIAEALHLHSTLARRNVMIKVPATEAGLVAVTELTARGIPVNVTLIFSQKRYREVANAYVAGLEKAAANGIALERIASVASFFVSRIDSTVDALLKSKGAHALLGKTAIANAKLAYVAFDEIFSSPTFKALEAKGAQPQRVLWASTGTKDPSYKDTLYVDELIGPQTVNTLPPATLTAFQDHGEPRASLQSDVEGARGVLAALPKHGVDLELVCGQLLEQGLHSFSAAMDELMGVIEARRLALMEQARERQTFALGNASEPVFAALEQAKQRGLAKGIWARSPKTFCDGEEAAASIKNRLGWLDAPHDMAGKVGELQRFAREAYEAGFRKVLLLGMGGSSLCPEVMSKTFARIPGYLDLQILDSTDPDAVLAAEKWANLDHTLFIVASKSGGTIEVASFAAHFWKKATDRFGDKAGSRFVAITDPGSPLSGLAEKSGYLRVFLNAPDIGGRYSALSYFGLVPAALMGLDVERLLDDAERMAKSCSGAVPAEENPGVRLGAFMAGLAKAGRDKLTLVASDEVSSLGGWIEQLVAESTGKQGKGVVPIVDEPLGEPEEYGQDRAFVYLRFGGREATELDERIARLVAAGHPVATLGMLDLPDLGGELFRWEMATAVAGALLEINPFDEPNVSEAKKETSRLIQEYQVTKALRFGEAVAPDSDKVLALVRSAGEGDYVVFSAFFQQTAERDALFQLMRTSVKTRRKRASTLGYGPRFLHSTGQLHKGGPNRCVVVAFTNDAQQDVAIPGQPYSFDVLRTAQALGDVNVLSSEHHRRRVIRVNVGKDVEAGLRLLATRFEGL